MGVFAYLCLGTNNLARAALFYDATMATIGHRRCDTGDEAGWDQWLGWGVYEQHGQLQDALWVCTPYDGRAATVGNGVMVALRAGTWEQVDAFHTAALAHGGSSDGPPGIREYNADFYAAYVRDPDGNKLAIVCRGFTTREGQ